MHTVQYGPHVSHVHPMNEINFNFQFLAKVLCKKHVTDKILNFEKMPTTPIVIVLATVNVVHDFACRKH